MSALWGAALRASGGTHTEPQNRPISARLPAHTWLTHPETTLTPGATASRARHCAHKCLCERPPADLVTRPRKAVAPIRRGYPADWHGQASPAQARWPHCRSRSALLNRSRRADQASQRSESWPATEKEGTAPPPCIKPACHVTWPGPDSLWKRGLDLQFRRSRRPGRHPAA